MRVADIKENVEAKEGSSSLSSIESASLVTHRSYHEMADVPVVEMDAISQLHTNLATLEALQDRLAFLMKEIRYVLKAE